MLAAYDEFILFIKSHYFQYATYNNHMVFKTISSGHKAHKTLLGINKSLKFVNNVSEY